MFKHVPHDPSEATILVRHMNEQCGVACMPRRGGGGEGQIKMGCGVHSHIFDDVCCGAAYAAGFKQREMQVNLQSIFCAPQVQMLHLAHTEGCMLPVQEQTAARASP